MLVHVAVAMIGLLAFSALVIDYGVMWVEPPPGAERRRRGGARRRDLAGVRQPDRFRPRARSRQDSRRRRTGCSASRRTSTLRQRRQRRLNGHQFPDLRPARLRPLTGDTCVRVERLPQRRQRIRCRRSSRRLFGRSRAGRAGDRDGADHHAATRRDCMKPWAVADKWDEYDRECNGIGYRRRTMSQTDVDRGLRHGTTRLGPDTGIRSTCRADA